MSLHTVTLYRRAAAAGGRTAHGEKPRGWTDVGPIERVEIQQASPGDMRRTPTGVALDGQRKVFFPPGTDVRRGDVFRVDTGHYAGDRYAIHDTYDPGLGWDMEADAALTQERFVEEAA